MDIEGMAGEIDLLDYQYNGNQLVSVDDEQGANYDNFGFRENNVHLTEEYFYDHNGNMYKDKNKGIDLITYNHLNLPTSIVFNNNLPEEKSISYLYTATGTKLQKHTHLNNNAEGPRTDYIGAFVYEDNELQFIQTTEGRLVPDGSGGYNYEYAIKDHLGNTRMMFSQTGEVLQDQNYYPFGLSMGEALTFDMPSSSPENRYLYNGKELQDDFGLGWYDYGARFYDPSLGRWHAVDPLAEERLWLSPYNYVQNNPLNRIDPDGALDDWVESADGDIYWDENATSQATTKEGETYLGKNVLVGTHNRDASGNEEINTAQFDLYLESDKTGPSASIIGNTVPGDVSKFGILAEGRYPARFQGRASKLADGIDDLSVIINEGKELPTVFGNPNKTNSDMLTAVFFHAGNYGKERLTYTRKDGSTGYISKGCQTSGCGQGSRPLHNTFMGKVGRDFNGYYYLRGRPQSKPTFQVPSYTTPIDNTFVAPIYRKTF